LADSRASGYSNDKKDSRRERNPEEAIKAQAGNNTGPLSGNTGKFHSPTRLSYISEIFNRSLETIERVQQQNGSNRVQLQFESESGDNVKIFLRYANGQLHSTFMTESDGIRTAIRDGWQHFQKQLAERGVDADQPGFRQDEDERRRQRKDDSEDSAPDEESGYFSPDNSFSPASSTRHGNAGKTVVSGDHNLNAYA